MAIENRKIFTGSGLVPVLAICAVIAVFLFISLRVIGYGYLPRDDALRHAAKAISGKDWQDILVLRDDIRIAPHPGWDTILGAVYRFANCSADSLVVFSVVSLFILFCLIPVLFLSRPEAWLATLLVAALANFSFITRLLMGRPYIFTMALTVLLCLLWPRFRERKTPYGALFFLTIYVALSTWIHGLWYLFALPVLCFFLAREWLAGFRILFASAAGVIVGGIFTAKPLMFLKQTFCHAVFAFGNHPLQRMLVGEFQPSRGDVIMVLFVCGFLIWRNIRGKWNSKVVDNPVFILGALCWVLGFVSTRFWLDWGMPAIAVWITLEFQEVINSRIGYASRRRLMLTLALAVTLFLAVTSDYGSRWTGNLSKEYLSLDNPKQSEWLPAKGGVVYSDEMRIFYDTFFKNPRAGWKYVLGFEPTMMPGEDLAIFRKIQWNFGDDESFEPWIRKMKPEDRLILRRPKSAPPDIPELEWYYAATGIWIGRLERK